MAIKGDKGTYWLAQLKQGLIETTTVSPSGQTTSQCDRRKLLAATFAAAGTTDHGDEQFQCDGAQEIPHEAILCPVDCHSAVADAADASQYASFLVTAAEQQRITARLNANDINTGLSGASVQQHQREFAAAVAAARAAATAPGGASPYVGTQVTKHFPGRGRCQT